MVRDPGVAIHNTQYEPSKKFLMTQFSWVYIKTIHIPCSVLTEKKA